jgi:phage tail sheath protein FI
MNDKATSTELGGKAGGGTISYENLPQSASPGTGIRNNIIASYLSAADILTSEGSSNANILIIPGIREPVVTDRVSNKVRDNSRMIYLMDIPTYDKSSNRLFEDSNVNINVNKTVDKFSARSIDNNYVATYFPDTFVNTTAVSKITRVPASVSAFQALGYNDSVKFPWFAPAGFNRGALDNVVNTTCKLNTADRDNLYEARINPIAQFATGAIVVFGQKTLQLDRSALDRVNVRRMVLEVKRIVSGIAGDFVFEQNTQLLKDRFIAQVTPRLALVQAEEGIDKFRVIMDSTNNTALDEEQNRLNGTIIIVPTRAVEFIAVDFIITNSGVIF